MACLGASVPTVHSHQNLSDHFLAKKMTATATLASKFQISILKAVREEANWKAGQENLSKRLVRKLGEEQADQVIAYTQKCLQGPARHSAHFEGAAPYSVAQQPH